jgi:single-stranded DNA-binding protein
MASGDVPITIAGNLTADPELRYTPVSREFAITEWSSGWNRRVGAVDDRI